MAKVKVKGQEIKRGLCKHQAESPLDGLLQEAHMSIGSTQNFSLPSHFSIVGRDLTDEAPSLIAQSQHPHMPIHHRPFSPHQ